MFSTRQRIAVRSQDQRKRVISSSQSSGSNFSSGANISVSSPGMSSQKDSLLTGIIPSTDDAQLRGYYRDIYDFDHVSGAAVDLLSSLPFSDWTLVGAEDDQLGVFNSAMDRLNFRSLLPELSIDYLVLGVFIGTLVYKKEAKQFTDLIPHNPDDIIQSATSPIYSADPQLQLRVNKSLKDLATSQDSYYSGLRERLNGSMISSLRSSIVTLDPLTTLYLPRKTYSTSTGTSFYRRILPIFLLERLLYRGTLTEATRRQRSILHITAGDEYWEPTEEELQGLVTLFQQADLDPIGAMVATRNDVQTAELRCLSGDTLVHTEKGLIPIKDLVEHDPNSLEEGTCFELDTRVKNHTGGYVPIESWYYQGKKQTFKVNLSSGSSISMTENHKLVTVSSDLKLDLVKCKEITGDTWLLRTNLSQKRTIPYALGLEYPNIETRPANSGLKLPELMTNKLAYCMALIISDGYVSPFTISVSNSDLRILRRYQRFMEKLFGIKPVILGPLKPNTSKPRLIRGKPANFQKDVYRAETHTSALVDVLSQLGVKPSYKLRTDVSSSYNKSVPNCILQADHSSQLGFLAGYLDGDGSIKAKQDIAEVHWRSTSRQICFSIHNMLADMGFNSKLGLQPSGVDHPGWCNFVTITYSQVDRLLKIMPPSIKAKDVGLRLVSRFHKNGIPGALVIAALQSRVIGRCKRNGDSGTDFIGDNGERVFVKGGYTTLFKPFIYASSPAYAESRSTFSYIKYDRGEYTEQMDLIYKVSPMLHARLTKLFEYKFIYERCESVVKDKVEHVYDITVNQKEAAPIFFANGILSKNSAGDFWKYTDIVDFTTTMKLRALGISESFLSGEANYNTAEVALSVFIEGLRAYRLSLTRRLFTNKLFPLISVINGFYKKDKVEAGVNPYLHTAAAQDVRLTNDIQFEMNDTSKLVIPEVHWHKQLKPQADRDYMELLGMLEEKGVPVTLRMWAAAGGLSMENVMDDLQEDKKLKDEIKEFKSKNGAADEESSGEDGYAVSSVMGRKPRSILDRDFGEQAEIVGQTKTGKPKPVNQRKENERANVNIAKALTSLSDESRLNQVLANTTRKIRI